MCLRSVVHALDLSDYNSREQHLHFVHRPDTGTPLKNKEKSNRYMAVSDSIAELLDDWIATRRPDVVRPRFERETEDGNTFARYVCVLT